jgi:ectoine hydroxylase-related dioxygenase (phytanoyl-CoA dioxygenase family)
VYQKVAQYLAPIAAQLMDSTSVKVYQDQVIVKESGTFSCPTIWHTDTPYYDIEGSQTVNAWIPLDRVPRPSTLEFWAGSHLKGPFIPRSYKTNLPLFDIENGIEIPQINSDRQSYDLRGWIVDPGDVVFHSLSTMHGSVCGSLEGRRVLAIRYIGDDCTVVKKDHFVVSSLGNKSFEGRPFPKVWPPYQPT